jgi:hypothetical protein
MNSPTMKTDLQQRIKRKTKKPSCYKLAKDLCGSIKGAVRDLSTNKRYLEGFGK